jgi:ferric-dicitrate binding protein FerR (iron transport regulator)
VTDSLESRVAVNSDNIGRLFAESDRTRARLHEHESALATVALLSQTVHDLREDMPQLARSAAREAVTELRRREHSDVLTNWRVILAALTLGVAVGALIVSIVLR